MQFSVLLTELHVVAATVHFQNTDFSIHMVFRYNLIEQDSAEHRIKMNCVKQSM